MTNGYSPQGWYADPMYAGGARYWNGVSWTETVSRGGITLNAPVDPSQATLPPVPGTQISAPPTTVAYTLPSDDSNDGSTLGVVLGVLIAFFLVLMFFAIISNDDSSDQSPPSTDAPASTEAPTTEAPAEGG